MKQITPDKTRPDQSEWNSENRIKCWQSTCRSHGQTWSGLSSFVWSM